jgi:predicted MFS family arabinose efflux permease
MMPRAGQDECVGGAAMSGEASSGLRAEALSSARWYVLFVLSLAYAVNIADRFVVNSLIEPIKKEFQLSDLGIGMLTGTAIALFYLFASVPIARLGDEVNRKRLIVLALSAWSLCTFFCGLSRSFWQFFVSRVGVGVGEAGATPISQSLLSDEFPADARSVAFTLFTMGAALGAALGASLGGRLNDNYGWRVALMAFGALGLPLAGLIAVTVKEPKRGRFDGTASARDHKLTDLLLLIWRDKALLHLFVGSMLLTLWSWGIIWWIPTFLLRSHHISLGDSGASLGWMHAVGGIPVAILTASILKRIGPKDKRYEWWLVATSTLLLTMPAIGAFATSNASVSIACLWVYIPGIYIFAGPSFAIAQNLVPAGMRSQVCALILFTANFANLVVSPVLVGALSDTVAPHLIDPAQSLRYVLLVSTLTGAWGAVHYFIGARHLNIRRFN